MTLTDTPWRDDAEALLPDLVELRRAVHREPELGLQNPKTLAKIKAALAGLPLEFREGPSTTGLIAILRGPANGRTVLLRGDMDALPLHEDTGLDFAQKQPALCMPAVMTPMSRCWWVPPGCCARDASN
jgi:metal-dependent amidase/aminoacylase/carboxypeptidase family protein